MYEANTADRSYKNTSAAKVASVAAVWSRMGFEPEVYAIVEVDGLIECRQAGVGTVRETAKALVAVAR